MQYESKKCQDQTGMKNDKLDDKTRWELIPLEYYLIDQFFNSPG